MNLRKIFLIKLPIHEDTVLIVTCNLTGRVVCLHKGTKWIDDGHETRDESLIFMWHINRPTFCSLVDLVEHFRFLASDSFFNLLLPHYDSCCVVNFPFSLQHRWCGWQIDGGVASGTKLTTTIDVKSKCDGKALDHQSRPY